MVRLRTLGRGFRGDDVLAQENDGMQRIAWLLSGLVLLAGCKVEMVGDARSEQKKLILVDGSSTVAPISMAIAEVFDDTHPDAIPKVNVSGTGGGFEAFYKGETDISNASRPMKDIERQRAGENNIRFSDLAIATDGVTVVVHPDNKWCNALTVKQLGEIWKKDSPIKTWKDLNPEWPDKNITLFGADSKSGTYDYFKEETVGKDNPFRTDYQPNTDDNVLVTGVAGDPYALGFFGFAYFAENTEKVKPVAIAKEDDLSKAVVPSQETIENGSYVPLSRPLFIYVNLESMKRPEVAAFVDFHLSDEGQRLVELKKYIKLNPEQLAASRAKLAEIKASLQ